jgi:hypothetical protein
MNRPPARVIALANADREHPARQSAMSKRREVIATRLTTTAATATTTT